MRAGLIVSSFVYKKIVRKLLKQNGFEVEELTTARIKDALQSGFNLLVFDERAVGTQILSLVRMTQNESSTPIICLLSRRGSEYEELKSIRDIYPIVPGLSSTDFRLEIESLVGTLSRSTRLPEQGSSCMSPSFEKNSSARRNTYERRESTENADILPEASSYRNPIASRTGGFKNGPKDIILIGASTGGVGAVSEVLKVLSEPMPPIIVIQHTARGSSKGLCKELTRFSQIPVIEAEKGQLAKPNYIYIAPTNDEHLILVNGKGGDFSFDFDSCPPVHHQRPAVDITFCSAAAVLKRRRAIAVLLTGMGRDGAEGLLALQRAGAHTIAESEKTAVVWGMPKAAIELGAANEVLDLNDIGVKLSQSGSARKRLSG